MLLLSGKSSLSSCQGIDNSRFSPCKTHSRQMAKMIGLDPENKVKVCFDCKMFDVSIWVSCLNTEDGHRGSPSHETFLVAPQEKV